VILHARILLKADAGAGGPGWDDDRIAEAVECGASTVYRVRQAFVEEGLPAALFRQKPTGRQYRKLDGAQEAHLIALACGAPPAGRANWTLRLLADRLVELDVVDSISPECVRMTLKKNELKPWLRQQWVIPPQANADFVCAMEDVLAVYTRPYDPARPVVCLDELNKQLVAEIQTPLPVEPGQPARFDYEYERCGTANLFMINEPLMGQRHVTVTEQRTAVDFAQVVRDLLEVRYPHAEKVVLVIDNLNTHKPAGPVSSVRAGRGTVADRPPGDSLHPQTRELAEYGRDRIEHPEPAVSGSAHSRSRHGHPRGGGLGTGPQRQPPAGELALHHPRCPHQAQAPLSVNSERVKH